MRVFIALASALVLLGSGLVRAETDGEWLLVAKDGQFQPNVLEVPANKPLVLLVRNAGRDAVEFESRSLRKERVIAAGREARISLPALKPGVYTFFDEYHEATGQGRLIVK